MTLLDDLAAENSARPGPKCAFVALYERLDDDTARDLRTALADRGIAGSVIASVLKKRGHPVGTYTVNRHRKLSCSCEHL